MESALRGSTAALPAATAAAKTAAQPAASVPPSVNTSFSPSPRTTTVARATAAFSRTTWSRAGLHRHDLARVCSSRRRDLRQRCAGTSTGAHSRRRGPSRPGARPGNLPSDALAPFAAAAFAYRAASLVAAALASHPACPHVTSAGRPGRLACHHHQLHKCRPPSGPRPTPEHHIWQPHRAPEPRQPLEKPASSGACCQPAHPLVPCEPPPESRAFLFRARDDGGGRHRAKRRHHGGGYGARRAAQPP